MLVKSDRLREHARSNGWSWQNHGRDYYQKDGYEIFFHENGFEFTIRDPNTMERTVVFDVRDIDIHSPLYHAIVGYVFEHAEEIAAHEQG